MKLSYFPLLIALNLSIGCSHSVSKFKLQHNKDIDKNISGELAKLNKQAYGYLANNEYSSLSDMFSDTLSHSISADFTQTFIPQMAKSLKDKGYKVFDEFYVENPILDSPINIAGGTGDNAYKFRFKSPNKQTYIALLTSKDSTNEIMLTLAWGNYDGKWKLNIIRGEDYSINGKNAIDFYKAARVYRDSGDFVDAINTMWFSTHCANPSGTYMSYEIANQINSFADSLGKELKEKYELPYTIKQLSTKPQVFNIHYEFMEGALTPMIMYLSTIPVNDTNKLKAENNEFHLRLGEIFTGMSKNNKSIIYRAFNQQPVPNTNPPYFGFVKRN